MLPDQDLIRRDAHKLKKTQNLRRLLEAQRNGLNARGQYITVKILFKQRKN